MISTRKRATLRALDARMTSGVGSDSTTVMPTFAMTFCEETFAAIVAPETVVTPSAEQPLSTSACEPSVA